MAREDWEGPTGALSADRAAGVGRGWGADRRRNYRGRRGGGDEGVLRSRRAGDQILAACGQEGGRGERAEVKGDGAKDGGAWNRVPAAGDARQTGGSGRDT